MKVTFEGTLHGVLSQMEEFCKSVIKDHTPPVTAKFEAPCPTHDQPEIETAPKDLLAACIELTNNDPTKTAIVKKLVAEYGCKSVKTLPEGTQDEFWAKLKGQL